MQHEDVRKAHLLGPFRESDVLFLPVKSGFLRSLFQEAFALACGTGEGFLELDGKSGLEIRSKPVPSTEGVQYEGV